MAHRERQKAVTGDWPPHLSSSAAQRLP